MKLLFLLSCSFLLLTGALGLTTTEDCGAARPDGSIPGRPEQIECYHLAALTAAYVQNLGLAQSICGQIWTNFGTPTYPDESDDVNRKAELETNNCYLDVARITGDSATCTLIDKRMGDPGTKLFGEEATREMCIQQAISVARIQPRYYYTDPDNNNLCSLIFILPIFVLLTLSVRK